MHDVLPLMHGAWHAFITHAVSCNTTGALRIYGSNPNRGMLQICKSGIWRGVCGTYWTCSAAKVACRQLGFTEGTIGTLVQF